VSSAIYANAKVDCCKRFIERTILRVYGRTLDASACTNQRLVTYEVTMKRFNSSKVRMLGNLQPISEKQKKFLRKARGISKPFASDAEPHEVVKVREFNGPMKPDWKPARRRGANCCRLDNTKRVAMVVAQAAHTAAREAFFEELAGMRRE
jgi:hypothetical protein